MSVVGWPRPSVKQSVCTVSAGVGSINNVAVRKLHTLISFMLYIVPSNGWAYEVCVLIVFHLILADAWSCQVFARFQFPYSLCAFWWQCQTPTCWVRYDTFFFEFCVHFVWKFEADSNFHGGLYRGNSRPRELAFLLWHCLTRCLCITWKGNEYKALYFSFSMLGRDTLTINVFLLVL